MAISELLRRPTVHNSLAARFSAVRNQTAALAAPLTAEDQMVQSCPDASPVKWHLAHTTWFFETFVLSRHLPDYQPFHPNFAWLFNSYYKSLGGHPEKQLRASFSRPALDQVLAYRRSVEDCIELLLSEYASDEVCKLIELGLHHEQQHQELIVTDIKHAFWSNPLQPVYSERPFLKEPAQPPRQQWVRYSGGVAEIGHIGDGFAFDNEMSRHRVLLAPFKLAFHPVTCGEYLSFMQDGGYLRPELWLSDGWDAVQAHGWRSPLYWHLAENEWTVFTLHGVIPVENLLATPVCHVSYYEAEAYARWAASRLPTEFEWEYAAAEIPVTGQFLEHGTLQPEACVTNSQPEYTSIPAQMFGSVWEWTQSAYLAYPGYSSAAGALGEYNGKFMCNQMVLRGGSVATPASHIRATYRNFFTPATRWQFSGIRLAADEQIGEPA